MHNAWQAGVRCSSVSFSIRLAGFQASGAAYMKLHGFQCHFHEVGGHNPPYGAFKIAWLVLFVSAGYRAAQITIHVGP